MSPADREASSAGASSAGALWALELPAEQMRALVAAAMDRLIPYLESLPDQPTIVHDDVEARARRISQPAPESGSDPVGLLSFVIDEAARQGFNAAGPGYLAYVPGGGLFHSAVADLVAGTLNRYVGVWQAAPLLAQIEATTLRWLADIVGYPSASLGLLTTGGSIANLIAVVTARRERLGDDFSGARVYASDQIHHSVRKALSFAGFPEHALRVIESDARFRIRIDAVRAAVVADRAAGFRPFLLVGSAGTTNTGAVDDLAGLAELSQAESLWLHVDAAYGGFFALTERGRQRLSGIERADSITLDPHKGLFLPYGTGGLLVRDGDALRRAHSVQADYMPGMQHSNEFVDFCEISPELSREFRGLRLWLPIMMHGLATFRAALDEKLDLARHAALGLEQLPEIEMVAQPELSLLAFRWTAPGHSEAQANAANRAFLDRINDRGRVHLTGTLVRGHFVLRICVLSFRTHLDRIDAALEDVTAALEELRIAGAGA